MTSEVALINRSAVALAADSALTIQYWNRQDSQWETRYFEGTNKIFHLSAVHPVGIMIYAAADLQGAPWDVLIKSYRDSLGSKSHDDLDGYAQGLFAYISDNGHVFGQAFQEEQFKSDVDSVAARIVNAIVSTKDFENAADDAAALAVFQKEITARTAIIDQANFIANAVQADLDGALAKFSTPMRETIEKDGFYTRFAGRIDFGALAEAGIRAIYKQKHSPLRSSGIVVAGFGDKNFFPRLEAYTCYGLVLGKLLWEQDPEKSQTISQTNGSAIVPFAQDEMIRTFAYGMAYSGFRKVNEEFVKAIESFWNELSQAGLASDVSNDAAKAKALGEAKAKVGSNFADGLVSDLIASHSNLLRQVIGMLPIAELAELAETLILIESLKERVTRPSESVGGPIDVAVISKNDGFIWIKRKHYFEPELNPRYFANRGMQRI
jgi:hypothetical protein